MKLRAFASLLVVALVALVTPAFGAEADKYLPDNTQAVIVFNVKQMLDSPLVKKDLSKVQDQIKSNADAAKTLEALAFDPLRDLESVTIGAAGVDDQDQVVIVARGKFNVAKFKEVAAKAAAEKKDDVKVHQANGQSIFEVSVPQSPKPFFVAIVDASTIFASAKQSLVTDAFEVQSGKKKGTVKKELQPLLAKSDPKQVLSVTILGSALGNGVPFGDKVDYINGGITLSDEIKTNFNITTKDAESAKGLAELLQGGLQQGKQFLDLFAQQDKRLAPLVDVIDVLKIDAKDNAISIKGDVSKEAIKKLEDAQKK
jgi:hypothetical protein